MTCRFLYANGRQKKQGENGSEWIVKRTIITLSHACARTRSIQEVLHFCCHKCHCTLCKHLCFNPLLALWHIFFNNKAIRVLYIRLTCQQKTRFFLLHFAKFIPLFPPISSLVWHLWQQKNNIAVGTRATRTREENAQCDSSLFLVRLFCLLLFDSARITSYNLVILSSLIVKSIVFENWNVSFSPFFPSLGQYLPIYLLGAHDGGAHHFPFSFTAKANLKYKIQVTLEPSSIIFTPTQLFAQCQILLEQPLVFTRSEFLAHFFISLFPISV